MDRFTKNVVGLALLFAGGYAYLFILDRADWVALVLMLVGANLVSNTQVTEALKGIASHLPGLR
jgi:hypothetical protein